MIYGYGICEPAVAAAVVGRRGLGGATLRAVERGRIAAVYSRHRSSRSGPIAKLVLEHEHVVESIMAAGAVLPLRFGTELARAEELADVLDERQDEFVRLLDRVRGRTELGIRLTPDRPSPGRHARDSSGRDYLLARAAEDRRSRQAIREVHDELAALARAASLRPPRPPALLAASYLVDADRVADFRRRADALGRRQTGLQLTVTGPWPPYSFATEERS